ncbi:MAG: FAD-dependent oxidoreductase [Clostridiales Family XIII bacterium]|jgi:2,4-dienoyl-CoA reductase-like NADH-dependent reductase (Old Yellow Enzyme family)/thioredoxin reductase|nr:FAD-dependent oxidoreductase [Clostridiales Family XIII bacterium]
MAEQKFNHLFSPLKVGHTVIRNRIEFAPGCYMLATGDGMVTREMISYYQSVAEGGAGIVTVGESPIDFKHAAGHRFQLNLGNPYVHAGLCQLGEAIHKNGAMASIEINHNGNQIITSGLPAISSSPRFTIREDRTAKAEGRRRRPVMEMTLSDIEDVIDGFVNAFATVQKAGFEMAMLHSGHGHLISQFISPYANHRDDNYGGNFENRLRFFDELLTAIRAKVGKNFIIETRVSGDELLEGGLHQEEMLEIMKRVQDRVDLCHVSAATLQDPLLTIYQMQPPYIEHGVNVHFAEFFKKNLDIPVTTVGAINDPVMANDIVATGKADVVAMIRAQLADHEFANKARKGEEEDIRPCIRCMTCIRWTGERAHPIRCSVNPLVGRESEYQYGYVQPPKKKRNVAIIGGGPAGMQAAITAAERGHEATIYEKDGVLGGTMILAATLPFKDDMRRYLKWLIRQVEKTPGVTVKLNTEATPELIKAENYDAIIVAGGSTPIIPKIPTEDPAKVVWVGDVDTGKVVPGQRIVMAGGGLSGLESALALAEQGKEVTVIDMIPESKFGAEGPRGGVYLNKNLGTNFITEVKLVRVTKEGAVIEDKNWRESVIPCDTVILALGVKARTELIEQFTGLAEDVIFIGDIRYPHNIFQAVHDGFHAGYRL